MIHKAIERAQARGEADEEGRKLGQIMTEGLCPYCKTEPAPRWGEPCAACQDEIEDAMDTSDLRRIVTRLEHRYARKARRRV